MIERTIAKRYAKALLDVAVQEKRVRETESEVLALADLYKTSRDFKVALGSPVIPRAQRKAAAEKALAGKAGPALVRFLQVLIEEGRVAILPNIAEAFDTLADEYEGIVRVSVASARPLAPAQRDRLQGALAALARGRQVDLTVSVDPALIGGLAVRVGDTVIDGSVAGRLKRIREHLTLGAV